MKIIYILALILFVQIYNRIINNPALINNSSYPFLLSTEKNDYYYIVTSGKSIRIKPEHEIIDEYKETDEYPQNFTFIVNSTNNYIYYSSQYFQIIYEPFISVKKLEVKDTEASQCYPMKTIGAIMQNNDFVIYGSYDKNLIFSKRFNEFQSSIEMKIILRNASCKFIQDTEYICAINSNNNDIYIIFLNYNIFDSKPTLTPINFIYFDDQCCSQVAHPNPNAPYKSVNSGHEESFSHRLLQINNPRPFSSLSGNNVFEKP